MPVEIITTDSEDKAEKEKIIALRNRFRYFNTVAEEKKEPVNVNEIQARLN